MIRVIRYSSRKTGVNVLRQERVELFAGYQLLEGGGTPLVLSNFFFSPSKHSLLGSIKLVAELWTSDGAQAASLRLINKSGADTEVTSSVLSTTNTSRTLLEADLDLGAALSQFNLTESPYELELSTAGGAGIFAYAGSVYLLIS